MSRLRDALAPIARDFAIHGPASFSLSGRRHELADTVGSGALSVAAFTLLRELLYLDLHCRRAQAAAGPWGEDRDFVAVLSGANTGMGPWHAGFSLVGSDEDGRQVVESHGLRLWAHPQGIRPDTERSGDPRAVLVRFPREYLEYSPGHYTALGDADTGQLRRSVRVYWNISAEGAAPLMHAVASALNGKRIPFQFKMLNSPFNFGRTDAAVLYLPFECAAAAMPSLEEAREGVRAHLRPDVSTFVRELAPGIGIAEDTVDAMSFGQQRSGLIAQALCVAQGSTDVAARVFEHLRGAGYDPDRYHLNPGSTGEVDALRLRER